MDNRVRGNDGALPSRAGGKPLRYTEASETEFVIPVETGIHLLRQGVPPSRAGTGRMDFRVRGNDGALPSRAGDKPPRYTEASETESVIPVETGTHLLRQGVPPSRAGTGRMDSRVCGGSSPVSWRDRQRKRMSASERQVGFNCISRAKEREMVSIP